MINCVFYFKAVRSVFRAVVVSSIDREFEFYEFFSFFKFNEFYEFFSVEKIRKKFVILQIIDV